MSETDKVFRGAIPEFYERYLVPLIFEPYARDLAARVTSAKPKRILEIAAGTGVVTRALASRQISLPPTSTCHARARQSPHGPE